VKHSAAFEQLQDGHGAAPSTLRRHGLLGTRPRQHAMSKQLCKHGAAKITG